MSDTPQERLSKLVAKAENNEYVTQDGKAFRYLGWYWRDIRPTSVSVSWHNGNLWLNKPTKWGYPSSSVSNERPDSDDYVPPEEWESDDLDAMCEDLVAVLEKTTEQGGVLKEDRERVQEILHEYAGPISVVWHRCTVDDCGAERRKRISLDAGDSIESHIEAEHPDALGEDDRSPNVGEHCERFVHHYIDTDPESDTRGEHLEPDEVDQ